jgi:hypothetical protein
VSQESFAVYKDLQMNYKKKGGEILYHFLNKVYDRTPKEVEEILPQYLHDLIRFQVLDNLSFNKGISKYIQMVPSIIADYPMLAEQFAQTLMVLYQEKVISFKDIIWYEKPEKPEDEPMIEDYYRIIANFLKILAG